MLVESSSHDFRIVRKNCTDFHIAVVVVEGCSIVDQDRRRRIGRTLDLAAVHHTDRVEEAFAVAFLESSGLVADRGVD